MLTEPVVAAVREALPEAPIGFVVKERFRDLVLGNPDVTRVHVFRGGSVRDLLVLSREIREAGYSAVVDLHGNPRSRFLSIRSGAHRRSSFRKREPGDSVRVRFLRGTYRASKLIAARYLDALEPLGVPHAYRRPRFHVEGGALERATLALREAGLDGARFAVVVPGSVWATKRWPEDRFASLARRIASELRLPVVLLGSESERELCARVASGSEAVNAAGRLSLGESAALVSLARLFVGNDSGPTHVAMALDVPTVAIFGPTDPSQFDFEGHALVYAGSDCSACSFFGNERCRLGHWDCMTAISVGDVLAAASDLLERRFGD